ncbi:Enhancer of split mgamma protein, partial [Caligus rogercresseyi]
NYPSAQDQRRSKLNPNPHPKMSFLFTESTNNGMSKTHHAVPASTNASTNSRSNDRSPPSPREESITKLEKADILELTVRHLRRLKRSDTPSPKNPSDRFIAGYTA